jgi:hypothetical protein
MTSLPLQHRKARALACVIALKRVLAATEDSSKTEALPLLGECPVIC